MTARDEERPAPKDDLDTYLATLNEHERAEVAAAEAAIDIAGFLYRAREHRGLSQVAAAERAGLLQQAVSRTVAEAVQSFPLHQKSPSPKSSVQHVLDNRCG